MCAFEKQSLTCLIIDDEQPAHVVLDYHIEKTPWLECCGHVYNAVEAMSIIPEMNPDLIFLDINMPNLSGLQLLDIIKLTKTAVILTSAYAEYAVDSYQYDITSFLLKPITFDKFLKAVNKVRPAAEQPAVTFPNTGITGEESEVVRDQILIEEQILGSFLNEEKFPSLHCNQDALWIRVEKRTFRIRYEEISFIESEKNYVRVHSKGGEWLTRGTLSDLQRNLPADKFVRTHRSYIVNRDAIKEIEGNTITMDDNFRVSISPSERFSVVKLLSH